VTHVQALSITLDDPSKNKITLGGSIQQSITSRMASDNYQLREEIPSESTVLELAKDNAIEMLEGTEGGYITFGFNEQNQIDEIRIMDSPLEESALKKWVWNLGGLGYLYRDSTSDDWNQLGAAVTMDGQIVADFITTGTMYADRIRGGTLTLGGLNNTAGMMSVRDATDTEVVNLSNQGVKTTGYGSAVGSNVFIQLSNGRLMGGQTSVDGEISWDHFMREGSTIHKSFAIRSNDGMVIRAPHFGVANRIDNYYYYTFSGTIPFISKIENIGGGAIRWYNGTITVLNGWIIDVSTGE
jgi:hypothetical protein